MSPPRKKEKQEEERLTPAANSRSGGVQFVFDKVSMLDENGRFSADFEVGGVPWRTRVAKVRIHGKDELVVSLHSGISQPTLWNIEVNYAVILIHSDSSKNISKKLFPKVLHREDSMAGIGIMDWEDLLDEDKGFVSDDKITIGILFNILNIKGVKIHPRIDFSDPNEPINDVALVINGEKIYASKQILAAHSPFFKSMFYGNFDEKDKKEIELKDVNREEFIEMLHVIYPSHKNITAYSAEYLLKLGDRFMIERLVEYTEIVLTSTNLIPNIHKLRIADNYRLFGLQEHCLSTLKTSQDFKDVKESPIYSNLSSDTKAVLFERLLKIV